MSAMLRLIHKVFRRLANLTAGDLRYKELAPDIWHMAKTGEGTDACLEHGVLPLLVHFYSPVPDIKDLQARNVFKQRSSLPGIDLRPEWQLRFLRQLGGEYGNECDWPLKGTHDAGQFYLENGCFTYACAAALHCLCRHFKPKRFLEIGSGNSSKVIAKALCLNALEASTNPCDYLVIDPYPAPQVERMQLAGLRRVIKNRVELLDFDEFDRLGENDILFVDSGHVAKLGADVNFLILEVLPRLKSGVIVHFHDINLPYAPPEECFTKSEFRVFWTEEFLLQAYLSNNPGWEILLGMKYIQMTHMDCFCQAFPRFKLENNWALSGSFWLRKK